jgi:uncharacterized membrane protein
MKSNKKKISSRKAVLYPIVVFVVGILVCIFVPMLSDTVDPERFGSLMGRLTVYAFVVAIIVGFISDRRRKKVNQEMSQMSD